MGFVCTRGAGGPGWFWVSAWMSSKNPDRTTCRAAHDDELDTGHPEGSARACLTIHVLGRRDRKRLEKAH